MDLKKLTSSEIKILTKRFPLPEDVKDVVMNREEIAVAMVTSTNTIGQWISQGMPVIQNGGNGKSYELQLSHCFAWRKAVIQAEDTRSEQVKEAQASMRLALVGGEDGDSLDALDPKQKREVIQSQMLLEEFKLTRNQLIKRGDVEELLDLTFSMVRDGLESAPDRVEREEAISPQVVSLLVDIMGEIAVDIENRISEFWNNKPLHGKSYMRRDLLDS